MAEANPATVTCKSPLDAVFQRCAACPRVGIGGKCFPGTGAIIQLMDDNIKVMNVCAGSHVTECDGSLIKPVKVLAFRRRGQDLGNRAYQVVGGKRFADASTETELFKVGDDGIVGITACDDCPDVRVQRHQEF